MDVLPGLLILSILWLLFDLNIVTLGFIVLVANHVGVTTKSTFGTQFEDWSIKIHTIEKEIEVLQIKKQYLEKQIDDNQKILQAQNNNLTPSNIAIHDRQDINTQRQMLQLQEENKEEIIEEHTTNQQKYDEQDSNNQEIKANVESSIQELGLEKNDFNENKYGISPRTEVANHEPDDSLETVKHKMCTQCGKQLPEDLKYCRHCGTQVD